MKIKALKPNATLPTRSTGGSAGYDLHACLESPITLEPHSRALVPVGVAIELPEDMEAQIRPRSGLALRHGITVLNAPGTIDSDYRGEIQVILINHGETSCEIIHGMRIAQMVFAQVAYPKLDLTGAFSETDRGPGGFGSTGI